jgi:ABC-type antimicrobial peptide transport system permease subunit
MKKALKVVGAAVGGIGGGFALAFLVCAATLVLALSTGRNTSLPGIILAMPGVENDALAVEFQLNFVGILIVVAVTSLVSALLATRQLPRRR